MAKRYGVLPSTILDCDLGEFQFNQLVFAKGVDAEIRAQEKSVKGIKRGR